MQDKMLKWLILIIPTVVIGIWEYVRHRFLLPYISMELGNWLSPLIIFVVTMTLLVPLFRRYEHVHEQLKQEKAEKAIYQEQERIARQLHDGIAQTLFLCSVQVKQMKHQNNPNQWNDLEENLREIHDYVRSAISHLKTETSASTIRLKEQIQNLSEQFQQQTAISVHQQLDFTEEMFTEKEKHELSSCVQEALLNVQKHAQATQVSIELQPQHQGWRLEITDNGQGFQRNPFQQEQRFGLQIMQERVSEIGGTLSFTRQKEETKIIIAKGKI
ncbi:two-component system, NarL family, nitrate/nitrite sensor histidine kinase NarQ [Seinonella peptonophila]|uniref:histidine kinase n=1 Tax=Seinonella peptonophila TaxID=112248 RepID=A0A1M4U6X5_9BACL|nr:ATP-binding protein [Seinonella peptonophila]SHE52393.1 two-component system, NarL family, nitrate/nitrite sensor histidine kinase NarQ [Seinonella peptonophila]